MIDVEDTEAIRKLNKSIILHYDHVIFKDAETNTDVLGGQLNKACDTSE